jgi:hypothetical protein
MMNHRLAVNNDRRTHTQETKRANDELDALTQAKEAAVVALQVDFCLCVCV